MPSNAQPIPFGVLIKPFLDFETVEGSFTNDEFKKSDLYFGM